jgi:hypothetical protein
LPSFSFPIVTFISFAFKHFYGKLRERRDRRRRFIEIKKDRKREKRKVEMKTAAIC